MKGERRCITRGTNSFPTRPTCPTMLFINRSVFLSCLCPADRAVSFDELMACCSFNLDREDDEKATVVVIPAFEHLHLPSQH